MQHFVECRLDSDECCRQPHRGELCRRAPNTCIVVRINKGRKRTPASNLNAVPGYTLHVENKGGRFAFTFLESRFKSFKNIEWFVSVLIRPLPYLSLRSRVLGRMYAVKSTSGEFTKNVFICQDKFEVTFYPLIMIYIRWWRIVSMKTMIEYRGIYFVQD